MRLQGSELHERDIVFVDNKKIVSDIVELDTEEGWVDILLPVIPQQVSEVLPEEAIRIASSNEPEEDLAPDLDMVLKRLSGKITIRKY